MSLATRCTACGTIFRVVQDQLRVSEGWVRCGRCAEVFDAREQLFDMDREAPPPWPPAAAEPHAEEPPLDVEPQPEPVAAPPNDDTWVLPPEHEPEHEPQQVATAHRAPPAPEPEPEPEPATDYLISQPAAEALHEAPARREPYWSEAQEAPTSRREPAPPVEPPSIAEDPRPDVLIDERLAGSLAAAQSAAVAAPPPDVAFLRQADGAARWRRPGMRIALGFAALLLSLLLALQLGLHFRDALQALYPPATPALQALCRLAGCELQPWQRIDALAVESSSLTQAGSGNNYKLTLLLRNKAAYPLALPWVDLHLSDASGGEVARRMLGPSDFNLSKAAIAGGAEENLQLVFSTGKLKVSGYTVEIFHP